MNGVSRGRPAIFAAIALCFVFAGCLTRFGGEGPSPDVEAAPPAPTGRGAPVRPNEGEVLPPDPRVNDGGAIDPLTCVRPQDCDDGNPCTVDVCAAGRCVHGPECPTRACTVSICDRRSGCLPPTAAPAGARCDDHLACTSGGTCDARGACVPGTPVPCDLDGGPDGACPAVPSAPLPPTGAITAWSGATLPTTPGASAVLEVEGLPVGSEVALVAADGGVVGRQPAPPEGLVRIGPLAAGAYTPRAYGPTGAVVHASGAVLRVGAVRSAASVGLEPDLAPPPAPCTGKVRCGRQVLCVDGRAAPNGDGTAARPMATVQDAIDAARDGDVVQVAGGLYAEAVAIVDKAVTLVGGYAPDFLTRDRDARATTLARPPTAPPDRGATVSLVDAKTSLVSGFRITAGTGRYDGDRLFEGGGVYVSSARSDPSSTPTLANCTVEENDLRVPAAGRPGCTARPAGAACSVNAECCSFSCAGVATDPDGGVRPGRCGPPDPDNWRGAGVHVDTVGARILNNVIARNRGGRGNGVAVLAARDARIRGNAIEDNVGWSDHGGGAYLLNYAVAFVQNRVAGNEIGRDLGYGWGGGVYVGEATEDPAAPNKGSARLAHGVVTGNRAPSIGSGVFVDNGATGYLDHMTVFGNACTSQGGTALYVDGYDATASWVTHAYLSFTTIAERPCVAPGGAPLATLLASNWANIHLDDSIVWTPGPAALDVFLLKDNYVPGRATTSAVVARNSIVGHWVAGTSYDWLGDDEIPASVTGPGVFLADPLFAAPAVGDFGLRSRAGRFDLAAGTWVQDGASSPGIDAAGTASPFAAEPAPNGGRANLGAWGNTPFASRSP